MCGGLTFLQYLVRYKVLRRGRELLPELLGGKEMGSSQSLGKELFESVVEVKMDQGLSFVMAVYKTLDEYWNMEIRNSGVKLACHKGCSFCCYQMVTCTKMEIDEIINFINEMERTLQRSLKRRINRFVIKWQRYYRENKAALAINPLQATKEESLAVIQKVHKDWRGKPCPFLNQEGACDIYPVRIIDCRTASSLTPCDPSDPKHVKDQEDSKRFRFECEWWANNLIADRQIQRFGYMATSPLHQWLYLYQSQNWRPIRDDELVMWR